MLVATQSHPTKRLILSLWPAVFDPNIDINQRVTGHWKARE